MFTLTTAARLLGLGALVIAATTALEVLTAPYSPTVSLYQLNPAAHGAKVVAVLVFVAGMLGVLRSRGDAVGRAGSVAGYAIVAGALAGAVPYSIAEASLSPSLSPAVANARLEGIYAEHAWLGIVASAAMPVWLLGVVVFGVVVLRRRLAPRWVPVVSLLAVPVAILAALVAETTGLPLPHPPAWVFAGFAAYGLGLARRRTADPRPGALAHSV